MSEIKVNKLTPRTACGTTTLGDSGDTINIPAGVTISNNGTATGFGATGAVNWDVASIKTVDFTAVSGVGYFVDTATTGAVIVTLPAAPAVGDVVGVADYANNFANANCTLNRNSLKIGGNAINATLKTNGVAVTLVYVDVTKGWIVTDSGNQTDAPTALFVAATGGCITTCGNYKIHTFTSPGTFTVTCAGNPGGSTITDYLVVAGGGGGGGSLGAGGGGGGFRLSNATCMSAPITSPLANPTGLTLPAAPYAITVGGSGAAGNNTSTPGSQGGTSSIATNIISAGGGGGRSSPTGVGLDGGSGGGGMGSVNGLMPTAYAGGAGNTPATPIAQGNPGGTGADGVLYATAGGGGGGAACTGQSAFLPGANNNSGYGGDGGAGSYVAQTGFAGCNGTTGPVPNARYFSGGGGGAINTVGSCGAGGAPGAGGGGQGFGQPGSPGGGQAATAGGLNTGGGGGGNPSCGGAGGSGIVILRYKYQ